ncbi:MAG: hypothetical protein K5856_05925, partial [Bacteroidaceae bacterium]|nr:hypothetical protein [Bacteroidaceae bacterium]
DKNEPESNGSAVSAAEENTPKVNVDFVFNVSTGNEATTRMTSANTQSVTTESFRGIDHAVVMSFIQSSPSIVANNTVATKGFYNMGDIMSAGFINQDPASTGVTKSRRVIELGLDVGVNSMMFWGKAIKNLTSKDQGDVVWTMDKNLANISFSLGKRIPDGTGAGSITAFNQYRNVIAAALTKIVGTVYTSSTAVTHGSESYTVPTAGIAWKDYVSVSGTTIAAKTKDPASNGSIDMSPLGQILANAFVNLNTIYTNEVRAGSGPALARTLGDLFVVVNKVYNATPTSVQEEVAKRVAGEIVTKISSIIDNPATHPTWNTDANKIITLSGLTTGIDEVTGDINGFPLTLFNVPQGATVLKYDVTNNTYSYNDAIPTYAMDGTPGGSFDPKTYRYPAELCYFGNSTIRVTDDTHTVAEYPDGVSDWDKDASWAAGATGTSSKAWTKDGTVLSSTRSVAMQNNINYGTALLKTTVQYGANTLEDNKSAIMSARTHSTESNNTIDVTRTGMFTLTGILVGGVEPEVGWNYIAKATSPSYSVFIYDNAIPNTVIPAGSGAPSAPNYTLVWDNYNPTIATNSKQNVVYIALELVNNTGSDFWGMNNLIRNGATFYITGKLDPNNDYTGKTPLSSTDGSVGITWPTNYALPPYDASGNTIKQRRIFIQDYMTEANFTIGPNSLQKALVAVPDLRSTQLSLGLSVDLSWSTGLSFDGIVLGD